MGLTVDKQTLDDLGIFAQRGQQSIYQIFNHTHTMGAAEVLENWMNYPLSDPVQIAERLALVRHYMDQDRVFPYKASWFDQALFYLDIEDERSRLQVQKESIWTKLQKWVQPDTEREKIRSGVIACSQIAAVFKQSLDELLHSPSAQFSSAMRRLASQLDGSPLMALPVWNEKSKIPYDELVRVDNLLRFQERDLFMLILQEIYQIDVYLTVARISRERGFCIPKLDSTNTSTLAYEGVYHPLIHQAKGNDIALDERHNIVFLTGANMAGKSTFMKSLGIALYLAHVGIPVPAKALTFSPRDAIYTSINLPDNIHMGFSHYYVEVLRVKRVAQQLVNGKKLFVIFDELFRGTNVKDAYDGTVAIAQRMYHHPLCQFVLSTHIIEAGEFLRGDYPDIRYAYLPTSLVAGKPVYTYELTPGITSDRHGMIIIENEGVLELLKLPSEKI